MNPQEIFCPNMDCPARGQTGKGNIHVHSQQDKRYICDVCEQTFSASNEKHRRPDLVPDLPARSGCPQRANP
jgi:transposase-like protein